MESHFAEEYLRLLNSLGPYARARIADIVAKRASYDDGYSAWRAKYIAPLLPLPEPPK